MKSGKNEFCGSSAGERNTHERQGIVFLPSAARRSHTDPRHGGASMVVLSPSKGSRIAAESVAVLFSSDEVCLADAPSGGAPRSERGCSRTSGVVGRAGGGRLRQARRAQRGAVGRAGSRRQAAAAERGRPRDGRTQTAPLLSGTPRALRPRSRAPRPPDARAAWRAPAVVGRRVRACVTRSVARCAEGGRGEGEQDRSALRGGRSPRGPGCFGGCCPLRSRRVVRAVLGERTA